MSSLLPYFRLKPNGIAGVPINRTHGVWLGVDPPLRAAVCQLWPALLGLRTRPRSFLRTDFAPTITGIFLFCCFALMTSAQSLRLSRDTPFITSIGSNVRTTKAVLGLGASPASRRSISLYDNRLGDVFLLCLTHGSASASCFPYLGGWPVETPTPATTVGVYAVGKLMEEGNAELCDLIKAAYHKFVSENIRPSQQLVALCFMRR